MNFAIREAGEVSLVLTDSKGKVLLQTTRFYQSPGIFNLPIDVSDLASGKYYYKISTGSSVYTRSITVLR
ncbi:MAG: hypothetical protein Kapaf2KO_08730 [Candidatus Kapaibacteriales bacterium]